jgi:hypothetical protein
VRRVTIRAATGMFAHAGQWCAGSDGGALAAPWGRWGCGVDVRPPSDSGISKQKARGGLLRAGLHSMLNVTRRTAEAQKESVGNEKARHRFRRGLTTLG